MTEPSEPLPNLFIVGAPKCGTTAWAEYLGSHPDIFFPKYKDHCYFAHDLPNFRLTRSAAEYAAQFEARGSARIVGEASAMYLFSKAAAAAIHAHNPDARILIFLRDQEEYLPSLHNQFLREFAEEIEDFESAWRLSGRRPKETIPPACLEPSTLDYAAMGRFAEQVERYVTRFPPERIRVIRFSEWTADPRHTYLGILDFLGLQDDGRTCFAPVNPGTSYRSRRLARWLTQPPPLARTIARVIRAFPFGHRFALAARRFGLRDRRGYPEVANSQLRDDIRQHFAENNRRLAGLLESTGIARE